MSASPEASSVLAIDAGGTKLLGALVDMQGRVLLEERRRVEPSAAFSGYLEQVARLVESLRGRAPTGVVRLTEASRGDIESASASERATGFGLGLALPGPLDNQTGIVHKAPNLGDFTDVPVRDWLEQRLGIGVTLINDAEAAAVGEGWLGVGREQTWRCLVVYTLGTGVGGGILIDGVPFRGASGAGGELGHVPIDPDGPLCGCGARGCLEAFAGRHAIERAAVAALGERAIEHRARFGALETRTLAIAARQGDADCLRVLFDVGVALGLGLAGLIATLAPERIVITGGVIGAWDLIAPSLLETVESRTFAAARRNLRILPTSLAGQSGLLGAARARMQAERAADGATRR